jgi:signal transduction histidine kinase
MPFPNKSSIVPQSPRLRCLMGKACRVQRRKLALSRKLSTQAIDLLVPNFQTGQVAKGHRYDESRSTPAEKIVEQSEVRETFLQAIVEACASNVAVLDEYGNILYVSNPWRLSAENQCLPVGQHPLDLNYLERWDGPNAAPSDKASALEADIQDILDGKVKEFHNEYWRPALTGAKWFVVHATRLELPGPTSVFRVLVNSEDTTRTRQAEEALRDLGGRLITAQEEERSRVARELHDDLNQRMALLSIELEQLAQRIPPDRDNIRQSIQNVWARAQEISSEIHRVSYQLHPSKLDHLGLVAAVKSLCSELGAHHEIKIAFREERCQGLLPKEVTLCLFRIVQESLRNVIKHSGALDATVALSGSENMIHLSVSDTGHGFAAGSTKARGGLGLISMRERLRLVDGVISIHSTAHGTKIEVSVPIGGAKIGSEETLLIDSISQITERLQ